jgi:DNA-binding beta-propeller fold protein YncE
MSNRFRLFGLLAALCLAHSAPAAAQPSYVLFESGPVRPLALSPDGQKLFVANTPEGHLEIFDVGAGGLLTPAGSVPVGLEPVTVAARSNAEVWVVNHLSDSVSIVDVASSPPRVVRTLLVGDEPRDLVFAGSPERAFITTAHRGQQRTHASIAAVPGAGDPQLTTEGVGRADVWVFNASSPGGALGGVPDRILTFFADTPRALATDGTTVYVAAFHSGNQTTVIPETSVPNSFTTGCGPGGVGTGMPGPSDNAAGAGAPQTGLILKRVGTDWVDAQGCSWNSAVELSLPDHDVFAVNANTLAAGSVFDHVGTILFNMALNPVTGKLYVSNTESRNEVRFEGPGDHGGSTVQGRLSESRISVLDPAGPSVDAQHLNQHIDYTQLHTDVGANHAFIDAQIPHSLATPLQIVVSDDLASQKVYVAAFGSAKVGVFDASEIEDPAFEANFEPTTASGGYLATGGGPAGLALDGDNERLFVYTRFDNAVAVYDVAGAPGPALQTMRLPTAEPESVVEGRPFLYDAVVTSGNGEASCASCHIFGDFDSLGWNLGNPDDVVTDNPQQFPPAAPGSGPDFHPMKGPMTTQTLRGLSTHGGMHWRGDRTNGFFNPTPSPCTNTTGGDCDEQVSFDNFIVAFEGLIGHDGLISTTDMQKFTEFALQLMMPPNPVAPIDGSQTTAEANGDSHYNTIPADAGVTCNACHTLDPSQGFFGSGGFQTFEGEPQVFKVAHLRNAYQKIGMFGLDGQTGFLGDQVRGFGFLHDGAIDTLFNFLDVGPFALNPTQIAELEEFMLAFPSDLAPVVGQQVSIGPSSPGSFASTDVNGRIDDLDTRAGTTFDSLVMGGAVPECDLIANVVEGGSVKGYARQSNGTFLPDDGGAAITENALRDKADPTGTDLDIQYTCVPPGSGQRMGIDRDEDSVLDGNDNCPAWPNGAALGTCIAGDATLLVSSCTASAQCGTGGICSLAQEDANTDGTGDACEPSLLPEPGSSAMLAAGAALLWGLSRRRGRVLRTSTHPSPSCPRR